ncbi:MAG TPA: hypothetical protein VFP79_03160 [Pseudolabrys sp.]|jgi:hypothetical protein|nr:hypothetical protein [Pseudolabrys sp.]
MPIDLAQVDWLYVVILAVFVFLTTLVGSLLSFGHRWTASTLSALLFAVLFVFWTYYPHRVPLPKTISMPSAAPASTATPAPAAPAAPAAPQRPRNPVTDITPPASPPTSPAPAAPATPPAGSTR